MGPAHAGEARKDCRARPREMVDISGRGCRAMFHVPVLRQDLYPAISFKLASRGRFSGDRLRFPHFLPSFFLASSHCRMKSTRLVFRSPRVRDRRAGRKKQSVNGSRTLLP